MTKEEIESIKQVLDEAGDQVQFVLVCLPDSSYIRGADFNPTLVIGQLEVAKQDLVAKVESKLDTALGSGPLNLCGQSF